MSENKNTIKDEQVSLASGGGIAIDARGYQDQRKFAVLEKQPTDEDGLRCPIEGCRGYLRYDQLEDYVWKFHCSVCGRIFLKRQSDNLWMGKIED